jgi:nickel/cobalt transporter (NicO) family protein
MQIDHLMPFIFTGLTISVLHAALPTHWLPFVLAAKAQNWNYRRLLTVLSIAGLGHVLTTTALGAGLIWFSLKLNENYESLFVLIASISTFLFGVYYIVQFLRGQRHSHCKHHHPHEHDYAKASQDGWAILGLLSLLTFSPCESFLPVYVSAWPAGWVGFMVLSVVLATGTLVAMIVFTTLAFFGYQQLKFKFLENYEKLIIGAVLIFLSIIVYFVEQGHNHPHG